MKTRLDHAETESVQAIVPSAARTHSVLNGHLTSTISLEAIRQALRGAIHYLRDRQQPDGHWVAELEGDTILESEYILLLQFLGKNDPEKFRKLANYIRSKQHPEGYWAIYPGGPPEVSASVKAYFACKLAGFSESEPFMIRARRAILSLGGVTHCNTFTKLYLSIFGQYDWYGVPVIPPELILMPKWFYFNIYEMSSWSRAILVPLSVINALRPYRPIPAHATIDELFVGGKNRKRMQLPWDSRPLTWRNVFLVVDKILKLYHASPIKPFRKLALQRCLQWLLEREENSGGLGAIFPAMTHAIMAYKCMGLPDDHPAIQKELKELAAFEIEEGDTIRLQPCVSPVWDTAISLNALLDSGYPPESEEIRKAAEWLLSKQTRKKGDWAVKVRNVEPGGWYFEKENEFYPDVDDTIMVLMALYKTYCHDGRPWTEAPPPVREAMRKGLNWVFAMQNRDGGWASFDKDNNRVLFQYVPYADHNAMLDPSSADITARVLEMCSYYGIGKTDPRVKRAIAYLYREQEEDGSWFGRWGVNYLYGTWQVLRGLARIGEDMRSERIQRAVRWLHSVQNEDGGWGESCQSYEPGHPKATGPSTPSQTAWALMGLFNAGDLSSCAVQRGIEYLLKNQTDDGTWQEEWFTGTGFPRVFYLRYHFYRHYFPLWALAQYHRFVAGEPGYTQEEAPTPADRFANLEV
ncbi:MAG TPA: squalene--hopene cyclase [Chthonomonas sp.]|uniref:squalene--hopene cyclase n=1 Tax=Chthonomonas sp. TaxID=2282153 RepID=UPI002B4B2E6E|nr:squalene--hopene cyclase [Chthonomonas sp.]HLI48121.1 squalene--hopene cyclase [Chthonomonas sp.]